MPVPTSPLYLPSISPKSPLYLACISPVSRLYLACISQVISLAFRRLAKQWHPDRWAAGSKAEQAEAETRFKQLNLAQAVLIDKAKRRRYDAGTLPLTSPPTPNPTPTCTPTPA